MKSYSKDPRLITVKYSTHCKTCGIVLNKGHKAYYWPATKAMFCVNCGEADYQEFLSSAMDEEVYLGRGNPW